LEASQRVEVVRAPVALVQGRYIGPELGNGLSVRQTMVFYQYIKILRIAQQDLVRNWLPEKSLTRISIARRLVAR